MGTKLYRLEWIKLCPLGEQLIGRYEEITDDLEYAKQLANKMSKEIGVSKANGDGTYQQPKRRTVSINLWELQDAQKPKFIAWWE